MTTAKDLDALIAAWLATMTTEDIRHQLATDTNRFHVAAQWAAAGPELPEALVDVVNSLLNTDPLTCTIRDTLIAAVDNAEPVDIAPLFADLAGRVMARPDCDAYQVLIAGYLLDELTDDDIPHPVRDRLARVAAEFANRLPHPDFAPVFLFYADAEPDDALRGAALRQAWARARPLPRPERRALAEDIALMADTDLDAPLVLESTSLVLSRLPGDPPLGHDTLAELHTQHAWALAVGDALQAARYLEDVVGRDRRLQEEPVLGAWFQILLNYGIAHAQDENPPLADLVQIADHLEAHRTWWPSGEATACTVAALLIARIHLSTNHPERTEPWLEYLSTRTVEAIGSQSDPADFDAEVAMLKVITAQHFGRTDVMEQLLREAGPLVAASTNPDYRVQWNAAAAALAAVVGDDVLSRISTDNVASLINDPSTPLAGYSRQDLTTAWQAHEHLMRLHKLITTMQLTEQDLPELERLCRQVPPDQPGQQIGAHFYAAVGHLMVGRSESSREHVDQLQALLEQQRSNPRDGGIPVSAITLMVAVFEIVVRLQHEGPCDAVLDDLAALRDREPGCGSTFDYLISRMLVILRTQRHHYGAAVQEGVRALRFHTRRAVTSPNPRERALMHDGFQALADSTFRAALLADTPKVAAEILEVVRAQPVPTARRTVPSAEQSLVDAATSLMQISPELSTDVWQSAWSAAAPVAAGHGGRSLIEESSLILSGLPSILMPWGAALADQLRDPDATGVVSVAVLQQEPAG